MKPPIGYYPEYFKEDATRLFEAFQKLDWEQRDAPRQEYYCNDVPKPYVYGRGKGQREYQPKPWTPELKYVQTAMESLLDTRLEVCFLNRHMNQKDQLGWHADNSPEMDDARPIVIVTFGVERKIYFRKWPLFTRGAAADLGPEHKETYGHHELTLQNGSVCVMLPGMQDEWQHRIPKASFQCGERISLTFRGYVET